MTTPEWDVHQARLLIGGTTYMGEWVRSTRWADGLAGPLPEGLDFRVVFLDRVPEQRPEGMGDERIAVVLAGGAAGSGPPPAVGRAESTLHEVREAREAYLTDPGAAQAADLQAASLEQAVATGWREAYAQGSIAAEPALDVDVVVVFADGEWGDWATRLGRMLVARSQPQAQADEVAAFLETVTRSLDLRPAAGRIDGWLEEVAGRVDAMTAGLQDLATAQGIGLAPEAARRLDQMRAVAAAAPTTGFEEAVLRVFGGLGGLSTVVQAWRQWRDARHHLPDLIAAIDFVGQAIVPRALGELATEREALSAQLHDQALQLAPQRWAGLAESSDAFRRSFAADYLRHHGDFHAGMSLLGQRLDDVALQAATLEMLNTITELGAPVSNDLPPLVEEMRNSIGSCGFALSGADLTATAACPRCGITLESELPEVEAQELGGYVQQALRTQNQRLARAVVHRLLARSDAQRLDRFVQAVQASDLSGLALVMDAELIGFIRALLREGGSA